MKRLMSIALFSALMIMPMMAQEKTEAPKSCPNHEWHQAHQVKPMMNDTAIAMKKAEFLKSKLELTDVQYEKAVNMYLERAAQHRQHMAQKPMMPQNCNKPCPQQCQKQGQHCQKPCPQKGQCPQKAEQK